jgi:hypothetical protein
MRSPRTVPSTREIVSPPSELIGVVGALAGAAHGNETPTANPKLCSDLIVILIRLPEPDPISRFARSPRVLGGLAAALLVAAIAVVLVVVLGGSSHTTRRVVLPKVGQIKLGPIDRSRQDLESVYTAGSAILTDPAGEINTAHELGFDTVRVDFAWGSIAPDPDSHTAPRFNASNPAAYPASGWAPYDTIFRLLHKYGMKLDLVLAPYPPTWALGKGEPPHNPPDWDPDAPMFAKFVTAVGTRYSGHYTPKGQSSPLPRADFWSIWNEPNSGDELAPQSAQSLHPLTNGAKLNVSPRYYRQLADAAWTSLHATGHGSDAIVIGDLAPLGAALNGAGGYFSVQSPLRFLRALYCVNEKFQKLLGAAATRAGCPATAAASAKFAADNPVLFHATDFATHPYPQALPPDDKIPGAPDDVVVASLPKLFTTLDRVNEAYGSSKRYDAYNLEYGYQTSPPDTQSGEISPAKAAKYLNWSEYLTWRLPRMLSYDQYLFEDPPPIPHKRYTGFATGIETYSGKRKPGFYALRMAVWLPKTTQPSGGKLEVWGCVRPAKNDPMAKRSPADIQFRAGSSGAWKTIAAVSTQTSHGYFDVEQKFPSTGTVRIKWSPSSGAPMYSRTTSITVH